MGTISMAASLAKTPTPSASLRLQSAFEPRSKELISTANPINSRSDHASQKQGCEYAHLRATTYCPKKFLPSGFERSCNYKDRKAGPIQARTAMAAEGAKTSEVGGKLKLYDMPVSNNGARVRFIIYGKGIEDEVEIVPPSELGGMKSEAYLELNPEGKMPLLVTPEGEAIPESKVICEYVLDKFKDKGPSYQPEPENKITCLLLERIHDIYITANQGAMYKQMEPPAREQGLKELAKQLRILERYAKAEPYLAGPSETTADHAVFPTMVFVDTIAPRVYGWTNYMDDKPKLKKWWAFMKEQPIAARIQGEIKGAFDAWFEENGRFDKFGITALVKENPERFRLENLEA